MRQQRQPQIRGEPCEQRQQRSLRASRLQASVRTGVFQIAFERADDGPARLRL